MRRLIISAITLAIAGSTFLLCRSATASLLRVITEQEAKEGSEVEIWPGSGTNIDFSQTGEVIRRVWLDDPSRITADFDGDLCNGDNCGAEIIHLRRINQVDFDHLPATSSTLLTVVTRDTTNQTSTYIFRITYGRGTQEYATVSISNPRPTPLAHEDDIQPGMVEAGLGVVIRNGTIDANSPIVSRTADFLARLAGGETAALAAQNAEISMAVILRLESEGRKFKLLNI